METLRASRVAVFGIGGVGSYAVEALARCGVGAIDVFDDDTVCLTNINRQLLAVHSTVGQKKVEAMRDRILDVNPECRVTVHECFYTAQNADEFPLDTYDYVVDAIDTISSKLTLAERAQQAGVPIISCMGAGNKLDPTRFEVADIYETSVCPLAKVMRRECKARGIASLKVVYSKEPPIKPQGRRTELQEKLRLPARHQEDLRHPAADPGERVLCTAGGGVCAGVGGGEGSGAGRRGRTDRGRADGGLRIA